MSTKEMRLERNFIFSLVDQEVFEDWHDEKRLENEHFQAFLKGME